MYDIKSNCELPLLLHIDFNVATMYEILQVFSSKWFCSDIFIWEISNNKFADFIINNVMSALPEGGSVA